MERVAYEANHNGHKFELYYDDEHVESIGVNTGVLFEGQLVDAPDRQPTITIKFRPGYMPLWREKALWLLHEARTTLTLRRPW